VVVTFCYFSFDYNRGHLLAPMLHDGLVVLKDYLKKAKLASGPQFLIRPHALRPKAGLRRVPRSWT
jgi:hypothetical protein